MRRFGGTRCPKDCPNRKPYCHNVDACEIWKKQVEENAERQAARDKRIASRRMTWE